MRWVTDKWWFDLPPGVRRREITRMIEEIEQILAKAPTELEHREGENDG